VQRGAAGARSGAERRVLNMGVGARVADRLRSDRGFTIPELLVAALIGLIVAGAAMTLLVTMVRSQPSVSERAAQVQQGRTMLEVLSRELRQGESVLSPTASGLTVLTYVNSAICGGAHASTAILCRVTYACNATSCTRTERNADGSGTASPVQVVREITGPNVFSYQGTAGDPSYVGIRLVFPADDGSEAITLDGGAALRNYFEAGA
jgi:prepilin-type N-terminal cleavage/methylation domain-containing protein